MSRSITKKLLYLFVLSLVVVVSTSFLIHILFFREYYLSESEKQLEELFYTVEKNIDRGDFQLFLSELDRREQVGIVVADPRLRYATYSHIPNGEGEKHLLERELHELLSSEMERLQGGDSVCVFVEGDEGPDRLVYVKRFTNQHYGIFTYATVAVENNLSAMGEFHLLAGFIACVVGLIFPLFFSRQFTRPIISMSAVTESLSNLDFETKVEVSTDDELGQLGRSINVLTEKLEEHRDALQKEIALQKVLTHNLSHELKTPLAVMKGYMEALQFGVADTPEAQEEYFQVIIEECDHMSHLISDMLRLSKLSSVAEDVLERGYFSSTDFVSGLVEQYTNLCSQQGISLTWQCDDFDIYGNQELLAQGFGNYITNAVKYGDKRVISITIYEKEEDVVFRLFNTGEPVPKEECDSLFDLFYMGDKSRKRQENSHGLGLSLSKTVAELHGGRVYCEEVLEELWKGMSFFLVIPKE